MSKIEEMKVMLLGNSSVGKSSLMIRYIDNKFSPEYISTLGVDNKQKIITLKNGKEVRLRIYDTAGEERFKAISTNFLKKADGIILVYDITNKPSFEEISEWIETTNENKENFCMVLVGNKCDLSDEIREITMEEGQNKANEYKVPFFETSCKDDINVKEVFEKIAEDIDNKQNLQKVIGIKIVDKKKKSKCC